MSDGLKGKCPTGLQTLLGGTLALHLFSLGAAGHSRRAAACRWARVALLVPSRWVGSVEGAVSP